MYKQTYNPCDECPCGVDKRDGSGNDSTCKICEFQAQQQEIERLKHSINNHIKWNKAHTKARVEQGELIDKLIKDKNEQAGTIMRLEAGLKRVIPILESSYNYRHVLENIKALLGGNDDAEKPQT